MARGERRDYQAVPIFLTADALQSVRIEYRGHQFAVNRTGYDRVKIDPADFPKEK
jgi:hypothetical protein